MKKFLLRICFFCILLLIIIVLGFVMPVTPRASKSLLFAKIQKDSLLQNVKKPRIIFIGGSNLSFGLNSQLIKDSLLLNPINTAISGGIGLQYMLDNSLPFIQKSDIVVVASEYDHFYGRIIYGEEELLRTIAEIDVSSRRKLNHQQIKNIYSYTLKYAFSKFKPTEYLWVKESDIYGANSFNKYGDVDKHWKLNKRDFYPSIISGTYNNETINILNQFREDLKKKGAILYITFPGFQAMAFDNSISQIEKVEKELTLNGFLLLGTPKRYRMPEEMIFNTSYHLSKKGVDYRTQLLIEDLKKAGTKNTK